MDSLQIGYYAGLASIGIHVIEKIFQLINHKRIRSNCCGKETIVSVDFEQTTPPSKDAV